MILAVGVRFDERVLSTVMSEWAPNAKIIHIDVDPAEISKNRAAHIGIAGEAAPALEALADAYQALPEPHDAGRARRLGGPDRRLEAPAPLPGGAGRRGIQPQNVVQSIYRITRGDAIVVTDVGQHQMWAAQHYLFDRPRRWITSGGLGTMGFGLPAALGAQVALPRRAGRGDLRRRLVRDDPAGASTAQMYGLPVKVVILNNGYLGMVRQWQELFWEGRYAGSSFAGFQPSFEGIARPTGSTRATCTTRASSMTPSPRPSPPTARRWSTCTSTRWPRSSRWSPRARARRDHRRAHRR